MLSNSGVEIDFPTLRITESGKVSGIR